MIAHLKYVVVSLVFSLLLSHFAIGQSFEKGDVVFDAGIKVSIYKISNPDDDDNNDDGDGAASYTIPIGFEYALNNRIGLGAEIGICNYFTGEDTITGAIAEASSFDVLLKANFHWVRGGKVDLYSGVGIGVSSFQYQSNDSKDSKFKSVGPYVHFKLFNARFYISNAFAVNLHVGVPYMNFSNGRIEDNLGSDYAYELKFVGVDIGTGLTFRF